MMPQPCWRSIRRISIACFLRSLDALIDVVAQVRAIEPDVDHRRIGSDMPSCARMSSLTFGGAVAVSASTGGLPSARPPRRARGTRDGSRAPTARCSAPRRPRTARRCTCVRRSRKPRLAEPLRRDVRDARPVLREPRERGLLVARRRASSRGAAPRCRARRACRADPSSARSAATRRA